MKKNLKKGFTLTELIVVIVIIGILAAVLIPTLTSYITRSRKSAAEQNAVSYLQEFQADVLNNNTDLYLEVSEFIAGSDEFWVESGDFCVKFKNGSLVADATVEKGNTSAPSFTAKAGLQTTATGYQYYFDTLSDTAEELKTVTVTTAKVVASTYVPVPQP